MSNPINSKHSSKIIFGAKLNQPSNKRTLVYLSGNFMGSTSKTTSTTNIATTSTTNDKDKDKIFLIGKTQSNHLIGITQHNLLYNISIDSSNQKVIFHKKIAMYCPNDSNSEKKNHKNIYQQNDGKEIYYLSDVTYLVDSKYISGNHFTFKYLTTTYTSTDTSCVNLYFNYGIKELPTSNKLTLDYEYFLDFPNSIPPTTRFDICFNYMNDNNTHMKSQPNQSDIEKLSVDIIFTSPMLTPSIVDGSYTFSNQIVFTETNPDKKTFYLDVDYIYYSGCNFYLYPFDGSFSLSVGNINLNIPQKTTKVLDFSNYFVGSAGAWKRWNLDLIATSDLTNEFYPIHFNNKIVYYNNINIYSDEIIYRFKCTAKPPKKDFEKGGIEITHHYDSGSNISAPKLIITSLNQLFLGPLYQKYKFIQTGTITEVAYFSITYNIVCNIFLCPIPSFPSNTQLRTVGSRGSNKMQMSERINTSISRKSKKTKFIKQNL